MRAATVKHNEIVIDEAPDPEPSVSEALVRVRAAYDRFESGGTVGKIVITS
jgi:NADPH:quinone reductase-like Zn-dependent oxidoreductase